MAMRPADAAAIMEPSRLVESKRVKIARRTPKRVAHACAFLRRQMVQPRSIDKDSRIAVVLDQLAQGSGGLGDQGLGLEQACISLNLGYRASLGRVSGDQDRVCAGGDRAHRQPRQDRRLAMARAAHHHKRPCRAGRQGPKGNRTFQGVR